MKRRCIEPDCLDLTERTRCPTHQAQYQRQRGYTTEYKRQHAQARRALASLVAAGTHCSRCGEPIDPNEPWDADRTPQGWQPAHRAHNRAAGARGEG